MGDGDAEGQDEEIFAAPADISAVGTTPSQIVDLVLPTKPTPPAPPAPFIPLPHSFPRLFHWFQFQILRGLLL
jgi:hypothetical protein